MTTDLAKRAIELSRKHGMHVSDAMRAALDEALAAGGTVDDVAARGIADGLLPSTVKRWADEHRDQP
jgi:hypothetical protein